MAVTPGFNISQAMKRQDAENAAFTIRMQSNFSNIQLPTHIIQVRQTTSPQLVTCHELQYHMLRRLLGFISYRCIAGAIMLVTLGWRNWFKLIVGVSAILGIIQYFHH
jgi:hypothetical protein